MEGLNPGARYEALKTRLEELVSDGTITDAIFSNLSMEDWRRIQEKLLEDDRVRGYWKNDATGTPE